jgi:hypothetical protein
MAARPCFSQLRTVFLWTRTAARFPPPNNSGAPSRDGDWDGDSPSLNPATAWSVFWTTEQPPRHSLLCLGGRAQRLPELCFDERIKIIDCVQGYSTGAPEYWAPTRDGKFSQGAWCAWVTPVLTNVRRSRLAAQKSRIVHSFTRIAKLQMRDTADAETALRGIIQTIPEGFSPRRASPQMEKAPTCCGSSACGREHPFNDIDQPVLSDEA